MNFDEALLANADWKTWCPNCGKPMERELGRLKHKRFCSDVCRYEWWGKRRKAAKEMLERFEAEAKPQGEKA